MKSDAVTVDSRIPAKRRALYGAFAATLLATGWFAIADDQGDPSGLTVAPTGRRVSTSSPSVSAPMPSTSMQARDWPARRTSRPGSEADVIDAAWSALPTAAEASSVAPPSAPKPMVGPVLPPIPPFAYTLIGRIDDGRPRALLAGPASSVDAGAGDVLDGQWRVDAVALDGVTLTWLPTGSQLHIGFKPS